MTAITLNDAGNIAVEALKAAIASAGISSDKGAVLLGYFCNEWNERSLSIPDTKTGPEMTSGVPVQQVKFKTFGQLEDLARESGLQATQAPASLLSTVPGTKQGMVVKGASTKSPRGDCYQYLVFGENELIAVGSEQGNYAGGIDWKNSSNLPIPALPVELQKLLSVLSDETKA